MSEDESPFTFDFWVKSTADAALLTFISKRDNFQQVATQIGGPPNACQAWAQLHSAVDKSRDNNLCWTEVSVNLLH